MLEGRDTHITSCNTRLGIMNGRIIRKYKVFHNSYRAVINDACCHTFTFNSLCLLLLLHAGVRFMQMRASSWTLLKITFVREFLWHSRLQRSLVSWHTRQRQRSSINWNWNSACLLSLPASGQSCQFSLSARFARKHFPMCTKSRCKCEINAAPGKKRRNFVEFLIDGRVLVCAFSSVCC